jgi:hypothetical protein
LAKLADTVRCLIGDHQRTREMFGGLSDTVGYGLEDRAIARLPILLRSEHDLEVEGRLVRRFVEYPEGGRPDQLLR